MSVLLPPLLKKYLDKPQHRLILFFGTYVSAILITLIVIIFRTNPIAALNRVMLFLITLLLFPSGLLSFFTPKFNAFPYEALFAFIFTPLFYLTLSLLGSFTKNRWVFRFLYFAFVIFLILNIVGTSTAVVNFRVE